MGRSVANILKVNPLKPLRIEDKTWLAAAIDGEGSLAFNVGYRKNTSGRKTLQAGPFITMPNLSIEFVRRALELTGVGHIYTYMPPQSHLSIMFRWDVRRYNDVYYLLRELVPHLIIKREQAKTILAFIELRASTPRVPHLNTYGKEQLNLIATVHELNGHNGKSRSAPIGEYRQRLNRHLDLGGAK